MDESRDLEGHRILVVEDEYLIASDITQAVRELGGEVLGPCPDPDAARRLLAEAERAPDGAVLDLNLKGGSVNELAWELHEQGITLLYHTGYQTTPIAEALPEGVMTTKPMVREKLMRKLVEALRRKPAAA